MSVTETMSADALTEQGNPLATVSKIIISLTY